jgi:hypothetical protein
LIAQEKPGRIFLQKINNITSYLAVKIFKPNAQSLFDKFMLFGQAFTEFFQYKLLIVKPKLELKKF